MSLLAGGCGTEEGYTDIVIPSGFIRTVNAIPDSPALLVEIGTQAPLLLNYGESSGFIASLPNLTLDMDVLHRGVDEDVLLIDDEPVLVDVDEEFTLILAGTLAAPQIFTIDNPVAGGFNPASEVLFQFAHAAGQVPGPVTFTLSQAGTTLSQSTLSFGQSDARFTVAPGNYQITVRDEATDTLLWDSGDYTPALGAQPLVMLLDYFGPGGNNVRAVNIDVDGERPFTNEDLPAAARSVHLAAGIDPISATVQDVEIGTLAFTEVGDSILVPGGAGRVEMTLADDPDNPLFQLDTFVTTPGEFQSLVAVSVSEGLSVSAVIENRRRIPTVAQLAVINGATEVSTIDIYIVEQGGSIADVLPRARLDALPTTRSSETLQLIGDNYDLYVTTAGTRDVLSGPHNISLDNNGTYSVFVINPVAGEPDIDVILADDFSPDG